ncbi:MAG: zinc ribbon domain-containing protein [Bryobacteraceae bacterium]|nr:zinc ribbon domain-containing protein [Bryobacteraceae bacterium]
MPLYEYRCDQCGSTFEIIQKFSDEPLTVHENCGGTVQRLISSPALQFKGSGWYITDYAKSGSSGAAKSAGDAGSSGDSKSSDSDSKGSDAPAAPAAKPSAAKSE